MTSTLASLKLKTPSSTAIPQLSMNQVFGDLIETSKNYFSIEPGARAADNNMLAVKIKESFVLTDENQTAFIKKCIDTVQNKYSLLKSLDKKLTLSLVFGVTATALSFVPFVGFLGWIGWAGAVHYMKQRAVVYKDFQDSLTLLVGCCNWSLGEGEGQRKNLAKDLTQNGCIRNMMAVLYPFLTNTQSQHLIADDLENAFLKEKLAYEQRFSLRTNSNTLFAEPAPKDNNIALSKKSAEFYRCVYGFNQGNAVDFLDAILSIVPDLYKAAVHGLQKWKHRWNEKPAEKVEEAPAPKPA